MSKMSILSSLQNMWTGKKIKFVLRRGHPMRGHWLDELCIDDDSWCEDVIVSVTMAAGHSVLFETLSGYKLQVRVDIHLEIIE